MQLTSLLDVNTAAEEEAWLAAREAVLMQARRRHAAAALLQRRLPLLLARLRVVRESSGRMRSYKMALTQSFHHCCCHLIVLDSKFASLLLSPLFLGGSYISRYVRAYVRVTCICNRFVS
eukprot:34453-Pelagomonas_calceolata.AAC.1